MTIVGNHTVGEVQDLLAAKDYTIKQMKAARAAASAPDATWDVDFANLQSRYGVASTKARAAIILSYQAPGTVGLVATESAYNAILNSLSKNVVENGPSTTSPGDLQDLDNRLKAAGTIADYSATPQPTAADVDLVVYQGADKVIKTGEDAAGKAAPFVLSGAIFAAGVGVIGLGVAAKVYLPSKK